MFPHIQNGPEVPQNLHRELSPAAESYAVVSGFLLSYKEKFFTVRLSTSHSSFTELVNTSIKILNY